MKVGDIVIRNLAGIEMQLTITEITDTLIICGWWTFDKKTGAEIDEDLGWNSEHTGSFISLNGS